MARILFYILNLIFVTVIGWLVARVLQGIFTKPAGPGGAHRMPRGTRPQVAGGETARDPVCGMFVSKEVSHRLRRGQETLHFCSPECLDRFQKNPTA